MLKPVSWAFVQNRHNANSSILQNQQSTVPDTLQCGWYPIWGLLKTLVVHYVIIHTVINKWNIFLGNSFFTKLSSNASLHQSHTPSLWWTWQRSTPQGRKVTSHVTILYGLGYWPTQCWNLFLVPLCKTATMQIPRFCKINNILCMTHCNVVDTQFGAFWKHWSSIM